MCLVFYRGVCLSVRASDKLRKKQSNFAGFSETDSWKNQLNSRKFSMLTTPKTNQLKTANFVGTFWANLIYLNSAAL